MTENFHTHTYRCHHATGTDREYIEKAIELGYKKLGFSDHLPQLYPGGFARSDRMALADIPEYFDTLTKLKAEYKKEIEIYIGFESEYQQGVTEPTLEHLKQFPLDYLILGQHFSTADSSEHYFSQTEDAGQLKQYVNEVIAAIKTGKFTFIAHPDVFNYAPDDDRYYTEMKRLCVAAKKANVPLECNMLGTGGFGNRRRNYPCDKFFKIAGEVGNEVLISCDAHQPEMLDNKEGYDICLNMLKKYGITPLTNIKLIKP